MKERGRWNPYLVGVGIGVLSWLAFGLVNPNRSILLDVRRPDEWDKGSIPGAIRIPLDEIRTRLEELPRDREIVVHCQSGQRSYFASRLLAQNGFRVRNLVGGFRTWRTARSED